MAPRGPSGEKRPAETVQAAHRVFAIAVGDIEDNKPSGRTRSGKAGAKARAEALSSEQRREIAKKASNARWG